METAAGVPLAVGIQALKTLNQWLKNREIAEAWYGSDVDDFTKPITLAKVRRALSLDEMRVDMAFTIQGEQWTELIRKCLEKCYSWHNARYNGECCWLPLYRAMKQDRTSNNKKNNDGETVLKPAEKYPSFIGTISSLPAAHLEAWGLVVMGYAAGGTLRFSEASGAFYATFDTYYFVLLIKRENMASPTVAHLTPINKNNGEFQPYTENEWKKLFLTGRSREESDDLFRWCNDPCCLKEPPEELINGELDQKIKQTIIDDPHAQVMKDKLRGSIHDCYDAWENLERNHCTCEFIKTRADQIKTNLLKSKLLSADETRSSYCQEMTANDLTRYSEKQLKIVRDEVDNIPPLKDVLPLHKVIVSFMKLLSLSKRVPKQLSTRNTGESLLLAGL
ncbi:hypothetical protein BDV38DRAFT_276716 [Aspergillus pseudotamarii]|uniref:Uncharacterized protein n=1 Tax=Aspergillus pseudotamarii TaxID=132259 RepID=A0A5N6TBE7_ASPPS|nr:uncharacterized protein BDV38DRAFT_276716 [Aspergillus pseudotamarii]KAE8143632.1 hypothetical protein BDV38DRAFT_276716 [Aspergillus pseudotamarii]